MRPLSSDWLLQHTISRGNVLQIYSFSPLLGPQVTEGCPVSSVDSNWCVIREHGRLCVKRELGTPL